MFSLHKKSSCYFDTHFSHPLFVLAAFAAAIVVCGVVVVVVVVGGLGLGGFGGFGAVFFFFFLLPLVVVVICEGDGKTHILTHSSINTTQTQEAHKSFEEAKVRETLKKTKSTNSR